MGTRKGKSAEYLTVHHRVIAKGKQNPAMKADLTVKPFDVVVWTRSGPFEIDFRSKRNSPEHGGARKAKYQSDANNEIRLLMRQVSNKWRFEYDILVDGDVVDPAIIIDPR